MTIPQIEARIEAAAKDIPIGHSGETRVAGKRVEIGKPGSHRRGNDTLYFVNNRGQQYTSAHLAAVAVYLITD